MKKLVSLFTDPKMAVVFFMGFASGFPLLLTASTLQAWLYEASISLKDIGLATLVAAPYNFKFLWSPFLDRFVPPFLGRRRGWMAMTQIGLILALLGLSFCDPQSSLVGIWVFAFTISFLSATQDIALDAYRREYLPIETFAFGNSLAITGYRIGMMAAGAGALILTKYMSWAGVYQTMAATMAIGLVVTLLAPEPHVDSAPPKTLKETFFDPFADFLKRGGAFWILAFLVFYKFGDNMATALSTAFYKSLGYSNATIGTTSKVFGIWATIAGGILGGIGLTYIGLKRSLWIFGGLQAAANLAFLWLTYAVPPGTAEGVFADFALATAITLENVSAGMSTAALTALMAGLTNKRFTATQYALFSSLMGVPRVMAGYPAGLLIEALGYRPFFIVCTIIAIPGLLLLLKVGQYADEAA